MKFIGRDTEVKILSQFYQSQYPEFLALYGRRRIGKTYLIREFFNAKKDGIFFNAIGAKDSPMKEQIRHFTMQMSKTFYRNATLQQGKNWDETFEELNNAIETHQNKKIILFFDELPWMATPRSRLLPTLDYYWNQYWSQNKRVKLIICGSSAAWIINKVIHHRGGLHNRVTRTMHLEPLDLLQTKYFLQHQKINFTEQQVLQIYLVTGGIPFYLSKIEKGLSASQVIESLAFSKNSFFLNEFEKLFSSLFDNKEDYITLIKLLAGSHYGIGERQLLQKIGKKTIGAKGKKILDDLEQTGFIMSFKPLYKKRNGIYYRLIDEYTLFYLKWIEPVKTSLREKSLEAGYWQNIQASPEWHSWKGYAFESVCYKHLPNIRKALNLTPSAFPSTWRYFPRQNTKQSGAQIDLLFDRPDDAITLCEIKYHEKPFTVTKSDVENILNKINVFKNRTKTKKQIFIAFISVNGIKNNYYAEDIINNVVTLNDLFQ